jgi:NADH-quinone oxidoreductase subunit G
MINLTINGIPVEVDNEATVLDAAKKANVHIPTLCHLKLHEAAYENKPASCRVCMVDIEKRPTLAPACATPVAEGMAVRTDTARAIKARRMMVELLLSNHPQNCLTCERNGNCELQALASELGIRDITYTGKMSFYPKDLTSLSLRRNPDKCIRCRRCEEMCNKVQTVGVYSATGRGFDTIVGTAFGADMVDTVCTFCGQCVTVCPTGALAEVDNTGKVWKAIFDKDTTVVVQTAPAVRVALGEEFGLPVGTRVTGKMAAALRRLGFDKVLDTDFAADLTIMEEASELVDRIVNKGPLPILTSCCPAWVKFIEHNFPTMLDIPSSAKSPHEMLGAIAKTYYAEKIGVDPEKIFVVSVMPCLAKKYEAARPELSSDGLSNVDTVISTRELARMIRESGIDFSTLPDEDFDPIMGESTGASVIFGTTGGVIEAACRTAYCWLTGEQPDALNLTQLRGLEGIREAKITIPTKDLGDLNLNIAIANGLGNARKLLEDVRDGKADYQAIEIMACPGGCVNGGGQPYKCNGFADVAIRAAALYDEDEAKTLRFSHENPQIIELYKEFLGEPLKSERAHHLLHTSYKPREMI